MSRAIFLLLALTISGCASQPQTSLPPADEQPVTAPDPTAGQTALDVAMFAERLKQIVAVVVADFLSPDYRNAGEH